jgi:hypothetical protein
MSLAWLAAAEKTTVNKPGLALAAVFVLVAVILVLFATRANRGRSKRAATYVREEAASGASAAPLPAHTWQAIANPDLASLLGLPNADAAAQMPALARFVVHQAESARSVSNVRSTAIANTTLVVFDHVQERPDGKGVERSVCGRFGLDLNCPSLDLTANEGFGTFVAPGSAMRSFKFEFDDFNQAFAVVGADEKFAFSLFDGEMMRWMLAHPRLRALHVQGAAAVTVFTCESPETDADSLFEFVSGFLSRIPPLVQHEWPKSSPCRCGRADRLAMSFGEGRGPNKYENNKPW